MLVSFAFGATVEAGSVAHPLLAALGIGGLLLGILGVAGSGMLAERLASRARAAKPDALQDPLLPQPADSEAEAGNLGVSAATAAAHGTDAFGGASQHPSTAAAAETVYWRRTLLGVLTAVATGLLGGLILAPMDYVRHDCRGMPFLPSMAAGVVLAAPVVTYAVHWLLTGKVGCALCLMLTTGCLLEPDEYTSAECALNRCAQDGGTCARAPVPSSPTASLSMAHCTCYAAHERQLSVQAVPCPAGDAGLATSTSCSSWPWFVRWVRM